MGSLARTITLVLLLATGLATPLLAVDLDGLFEVGTISLDEDAGDLAAMQETYNIHEGFNVSRILLRGRFEDGDSFDLDLDEINLDSRRGRLEYRRPGLGRLSLRHEKHRQLFDAAGSVAAMRESWRLGARLTPARWLRLSADYDRQDRDGDRLSYPEGTDTRLGDRYDHRLGVGRFEAEARRDGRGLALGFETSTLNDDLTGRLDRRGRVFSARAFGACYLLPSLSHYARASHGKQELTASDLEHTLTTLQYVGTAKPDDRLRLRYKFYLSRVEDDATALRTDYVRNDLDLIWHHARGRLFGGYGYVTHDDDRSLSHSHAWRVGGTWSRGSELKAKVSYAASEKTDEERLTLLRDVETSRLRASLESRPLENLDLGATYADRSRAFPVLDVEAEGRSVNVHGRLRVPDWGRVSADYTYTDEDYEDRAAGFAVDSHAVTGRLDFTRLPDLELAAGLTYLDVGGDLDIEKIVVMLEGRFDLLEDYYLEVAYNAYNYDDYILMDRYYTANVVRVNVGYRLSLN
jgi:hypothetical protein